MARPTFTATLDELSDDPHPVLAAMRAQGAVVFVPALEGWVVTTRDMALQVMRDADTFTVDHPGFTTGQVVGPSMLSLDGVEHAHHREPFLSYYRASVVRDELEPWMAAEATRRVAELAAAGAGDLRADFAAPFAATVIAESLGLVDTPVDTMVTWYLGIVGAVDALSVGDQPGEAGAAAMLDLAAAVRRTIDADPGSMLGRVQAESSLSFDQIVSNVAVLMFGAIETAEAMIANALWFLLNDGQAMEAARSDRLVLVDAIEESLRLEPAATRVDRYATRDVSIGRAQIGAGELVIISLAAAGRDPAVFAAPDEFHVDRANARQHLGFVQGPHACIGIHLARAETVVALDAVLTGLPELALTPESPAPTGLVFRKPQTLNTTWRAYPGSDPKPPNGV